MQGLGVFADAAGVSHRPPILWDGNATVLDWTLARPYIVTLTRLGVRVYSMIDQKLQQRLTQVVDHLAEGRQTQRQHRELSRRWRGKRQCRTGCDDLPRTHH